jgi:hypothetical protein
MRQFKQNGDMMLFWILAEALRMEKVCFSETLASTDESTRRYKPEEQHHHPHRRDNHKSQNRDMTKTTL